MLSQCRHFSFKATLCLTLPLPRHMFQILNIVNPHLSMFPSRSRLWLIKWRSCVPSGLFFLYAAFAAHACHLASILVSVSLLILTLCFWILLWLQISLQDCMNREFLSLAILSLFPPLSRPPGKWHMVRCRAAKQSLVMWQRWIGMMDDETRKEQRELQRTDKLLCPPWQFSTLCVKHYWWHFLRQ